MTKLAEIDIDRTIPVFKVQDDPKIAAKEIKKVLNADFTTDKKEFLKALIGKFAEQNILVFEFVETWNKKEKANIDGFFLNPNVIVLKRQQNSFRREIFTLIHELGHFLLNEEEIEQVDYQSLGKTNLSKIEKWCNDFAYHFLVGDYADVIEAIEKADVTNDYQFEIIKEVSDNTHLSQIALFTRLLFQNKITQSNYNLIKADFDEQYRLRDEAIKKQRELDKQKGIISSGSAPKPIISPLLVSTVQAAYFMGVINEYEVCKKLNIKPAKFLRQVDNQFVNGVIKNRLSPVEYENRKNDFMNSADMKLILFCLNLKKNNPEEAVFLVTEKTEDSNDSKVFKKIPTICRILELETITLPQMLDKFDQIELEFR